MKLLIVGLISVKNNKMSDKVLDEMYMRHALDLAQQGADCGEVPVGAILVKNNKLISSGHNQSITLSDPTAHAEINAIRKASQILENYRLPDSTLYVTLEPCAMCAGAIFQSRISRVVFGAWESKTGSAGSVINLFENKLINHHASISGGVLESDCSLMLQSFFKDRRRVKLCCEK